MSDAPACSPPAPPRWRALGPIERRLLGVLIEKAKTTPENYPLSLNALRTGSNQKSNRAPLMQLEEDQVEEALGELRRAGAIAEIQGGSRVDKYRHLAYEWLGVDKVELAVMAELLLRGEQTVGELRGRAARMEPIADLAALRPILASLESKGLILYLTPPGRGSVVTHALYLERELDKLRRESGAPAAGPASPAVATRPADRPTGRPAGFPVDERDDERDDHGAGTSGPAAAPRSPATLAGSAGDAGPLAAEIRQLRAELAGLQREFQSVRTEFESTADQLRRQLEDLNRQLGN